MARGREWSRLDLTRASAGSQPAAAIVSVATRPASASQCEREIRAEPIAAPPATESRIPVGRVNPESGLLAVFGMPQFAEIARDNHDGGAAAHAPARLCAEMKSTRAANSGPALVPRVSGLTRIRPHLAQVAHAWLAGRASPIEPRQRVPLDRCSAR